MIQVPTYEPNDREQLRKEMEAAGVFGALERLTLQGTSWDQVSRDIHLKLYDKLACRRPSQKVARYDASKSIGYEMRCAMHASRRLDDLTIKYIILKPIELEIEGLRIQAEQNIAFEKLKSIIG